MFAGLKEWVNDNIIHCDVDVFDTLLVFIFCFVSVACFAVSIKMMLKKEYLASTVMFTVGSVFFRDVCKALRKTKKEISILEKRIDKDWRILLGRRYFICTCRTCANRFSCTNAYGDREVNGICSINKYKE